MVNEPLVSIGVPVYNGGDYLEESLRSIQNQNYQNWECHIINNASTDNTGEVAQKMVDEDSRFKLHYYDELYPIAQNWNRTVNHISPDAKYYKLVQADDWIYENYLSDMIQIMEENDNVGMCSSYRMNGDEVDCDGLNFYEGPVFNGKELLRMHLDEKIDITGSITTLMFRMDTLKQMSFFPKIYDEEDFHFDTLLAYHAMNLADIGFVFKVLSYTRWHPEALTSKICIKYNTFLNAKERRLFQFKDYLPEYQEEYKKHRLSYAYFMTKKKVSNQKDCVAWHNGYLTRKFTTGEIVKGILQNNGVTYRVKKLFAL